MKVHKTAMEWGFDGALYFVALCKQRSPTALHDKWSRVTCERCLKRAHEAGEKK